jgi:hypothetical protein
METQYIKKSNYSTDYYADEEMTVLHRLDGPAVEYAGGSKAWFVEGKRHRLDGPAIERADGWVGKEWWVEGKLHRTDGPAMEYADGYKAWWVEGKRHRLDGPAIERADGWVGKEWWVEGKLHRTDGPAVKYAGGSKAWWVEGKRLTEADFKMMHEPKEITLEQIAEKFGIELSKLRIKS